MSLLPQMGTYFLKVIGGQVMSRLISLHACGCGHSRRDRHESTSAFSTLAGNPGSQCWDRRIRRWTEPGSPINHWVEKRFLWPTGALPEWEVTVHCANATDMQGLLVIAAQRAQPDRCSFAGYLVSSGNVLDWTKEKQVRSDTQSICRMTVHISELKARW